MAKKKAVSELVHEKETYARVQDNIKELMDIGYSYQQACDWLRKKNIQSLFEKDERVKNDD